jgi:hypothetical protein
MRQSIKGWVLPALIVAMLASPGCEPSGVGDPCIPEEEYHTDFAGFAVTEGNVESRSFQCETRVCLVNHFRGRVSCPYGQNLTDPAVQQAPGTDTRRCVVPGTSGDNADDVIDVSVDAQLVDRPADRSVYCSCRCAGPDPNARYCECPSGYSCDEVLPHLGSGLGSSQLAGSYCIKVATNFDPTQTQGPPCQLDQRDCGDPRP